MRVWRAKRDLTRGEAAEAFGVDASHWSLLEDGERHASPKLAKRLAKAMNQPIEVFLNFEASK